MKIKNFLIAIMMVFSFGGGLMALAPVETASAAECTSRFLGFPAWYRGLIDDSCNIKSPNEVGGLSKFIWHIVLNCVEIAVVATGYIAAFYLIYGGFLFMTSTGDPTDAAKARKVILNAVVGLVISLVAVTVIGFIIERLFAV